MNIKEYIKKETKETCVSKCLEWQKEQITVKKFPVITLCGSTKFKEDFLRIQEELTLQGNVVISVGLFGHVDKPQIMNTDIKIMLDKMHKQKIDMSDTIYVINKNGYIGESTANEIEHAKLKNKSIIYLEEIDR